MVLLGGFEDESAVQVSSPRTVAFLNAPIPVVSGSSAGHSSSSSSSRGMTTNATVMNDEVSSVAVAEEKKMVTPTASKDAADSGSFAGPAQGEEGKSKGGSSPAKGPSAPVEDEDAEVSPQSHDPSEAGIAASYPHLLPQSGSHAGYYLGYNPSAAAEPPSPSPAGMATISYDAAAFFQQPGAFAPLTRGQAAAAAAAAGSPLSPPRALATMTVVPPASPLFPRANHSHHSNAGGGPRLVAAPPSPGLAYVTPALGGYHHQQAYSVVQAAGGSHSGDSPDAAWGERYGAGQTAYQQSSPQTMAYGMPVQTRAGRAYSFEETMLPPSALDQLSEQQQQQQQTNLTYSPYGGSQASPVPGMSATLFAQPSWFGVGAAPLDMYGSPGSPLQPRPSPHMGMYAGGGGGGMGGIGGAAAAAGTMRGGPSMVSPGSMSPYGPYYPASSPGPPIQTTSSNKGPEGANLFIFHIPNHFTNLDMYQLFCPYGTLLSVRIMVEKDTGRSRGFGFVSYDNPESAAMAIKELNGFAIGNKRLKVQHKQIRNNSGRDGGSFDAADAASPFPPPPSRPPHMNSASSLPPSGPMASQNLWYKAGQESPVDESLVGSTGGAASAHLAATDDDDDDGPELTAGTPLVGADLSADPSPLASLGSLQNALPDISGKGENSSSLATAE